MNAKERATVRRNRWVLIINNRKYFLLLAEIRLKAAGSFRVHLLLTSQVEVCVLSAWNLRLNLELSDISPLVERSVILTILYLSCD